MAKEEEGVRAEVAPPHQDQAVPETLMIRVTGLASTAPMPTLDQPLPVRCATSTGESCHHRVPFSVEALTKKRCYSTRVVPLS